MRRKTCIFRNFVILFMAIGLFATFVGCKNDDNPAQVDEKVQSLRTELTQQMDAKAKSLQDQLDEAKAKLNELSNGSVTSAQLEAAKQEVLNATITKEAFEQYKTAMEARFDKAASVEELNSLKDKYTDIESRVAALESLTGGNLAKTLADLKAEFNGLLNEKVDALEAKIAANKADLLTMLEDYKKVANGNITANTTKIQALEKKLEKMEKDLNVSIVSGMLNSRLTSLVLLPDVVADNGGALPIVLFSPLETVNCGKISPAVEVKYVVSPSTVTASDIDIKNLKFRYNAPKVLAKNPGKESVVTKAEFVSLENGILTVKANLNLDATWVANPTKNTENRIDQIMLEVPAAKGDVVVSSDWAKVDFRSKTAEIVKTPKKAAADAWSNYVLKPTAAGAKAIDVTNNAQNYTVVNMVWDQELDLRSVVKSMYSDWKEFAPSTYGLSFSFDMNDENGDKIVYPLGNKNETDQQEFIKIHADGYTVSTKVYTKDANEAAVNRTPIVHVMLKTANGCLVKEGFIKIRIVEKTIDPIEIKKTGKHEAVCGENELYRIKTQEMNEEFYHKVGMSKADFHKNYTFAMVPLDASDANNVGVIEQVKDPKDTDSFNVVYKLTEAEAWSHVGKTVWAEATYTSATSIIKIRFEFTITREKLDLDLLIDNYWQKGAYKYIVQNVRVPNVGDTNPALATFENNINNAFVTVKGGQTLNLNNNVTPANKYDNYTYEYVFDEAKNQPVKTVDGITISVSANRKQLLATKGATTEVVAEILPQSATSGDVLEYKSTDLAKYLLNKGPEFMKARIVLQVKNTCGKQVDVEVKKLADKDRFNVHFLRPVNVAPQAGDNFIDGVDFGKRGSYLDMKKVAKLSDWRNYIKNVNLYDFLPNNENYYDYYGVQNVKVDIKNIKTEGLVGSSPDLASTIKVEQTPNNEVFNGDLYKYGRLTYKNNGTNLDKEFTLIVPVTVEYKWGAVKTQVRVIVEPTKTKAKK